MRCIALTVALVIALCAPAQAAKNCTFLAVPPLAFGTYGVFSPVAAPATSAIEFSCNVKGLPFTLSLSPGDSGSFAQRYLQMTGRSSAHLLYNAYVDSALTEIFGDGTGGSYVYSGETPNAANAPVYASVYASAPAGQDVAPGSYGDALTVTLSF